MQGCFLAPLCGGVVPSPFPSSPVGWPGWSWSRSALPAQQHPDTLGQARRGPVAPFPVCGSQLTRLPISASNRSSAAFCWHLEPFYAPGPDSQPGFLPLDGPKMSHCFTHYAGPPCFLVSTHFLCATSMGCQHSGSLLRLSARLPCLEQGSWTFPGFAPPFAPLLPSLPSPLT